jgi:hypothetical protein
VCEFKNVGVHNFSCVI